MKEQKPKKKIIRKRKRKVELLKATIPATTIEEVKNSPEAVSIKEDIGIYKDLSVFHDSPGGQLLIKNLLTDITTSIDVLCNNTKEYTHIQLVAEISKIKERLDLIRTLANSGINLEDAEEMLKDMLKDSLIDNS